MNNIKNNLTTSLSNSRSYLEKTHLENYALKIEQFKQDEDFNKIILLGELALNDKNVSFRDVIKIHTQLSSTYFYQGRYDLSLEHATKCQLMAEYLDEPSFLIQSLYLLSANKRALSTFSSNPTEKNDLIKDAKSYINKATKHLNQVNCEYLKAKVLFNAGAAYTNESKKDLEIATHFFNDAVDIFLTQGKFLDYSRTLIRLAHIYLLQKREDETLTFLKKINYSELTNKTKVHYHYLEAKYFIEIKKFYSASSIILDAIELANKLEMTRDLDRLNTLMKQIQIEDDQIYMCQGAIKC